MPTVGSLRTMVVDDDMVEGTRRHGKVRSPAHLVEDLPLLLPSHLPQAYRDDPTLKSLRGKERRLRVAQADDALADIRHLRCVITRIAQFRRFNVNGTGGERTSRMRSLHDKFQAKVVLAAERYRAAYRALTALDPTGAWRARLQPLLDGDIRGPGQDDHGVVDPRGRLTINNGREKISWIWRVAGVPVSGDLQAEDLTKGMQVQWSKARARLERWREDKVMLQEEMRRVLAFFEYKATWWTGQRARRSDEGVALQQGVAAYADKQADIYRRLAKKFASQWLPYLMSQSIVPLWASQYPSLPPTDIDLDSVSSMSSSDDSSVE